MRRPLLAMSAVALGILAATPTRAFDFSTANFGGGNVQTHHEVVSAHRRPGRPSRPQFNQLRPARHDHLLVVASRYLGARNPTGTRGPWCRDFVNFTLLEAGRRPANTSRLAIDALTLGPHVSTPQPGDIVVMHGHAAFFAGWGGRGVLALGGNQHGRVAVSSFSMRAVIAFVRPF